MSGNPDDPVDLSSLAPSDAFTERLPAIGELAARVSAEERDFGAHLASSSRWFVPIAAASAAACWVVAARVEPAPAPTTTTAALLGAASDEEIARVLAAPGGSR